MATDKNRQKRTATDNRDVMAKADMAALIDWATDMTKAIDARAELMLEVMSMFPERDCGEKVIAAIGRLEVDNVDEMRDLAAYVRHARKNRIPHALIRFNVAHDLFQFRKDPLFVPRSKGYAAREGGGIPGSDNSDRSDKSDRSNGAE